MAAKAGKWAGKTLEQQAKARGYNYLTAKCDLAGVASADQKRPLLGLFATGNLPVEFAPRLARSRWRQRPAQSCDPEPTLSQVESASIDKRDHAADPCGQIGETRRLDEVVTKALDFARRDGRTPLLPT